jgi:outer membrane protein assembly factor BamA
LKTNNCTVGTTRWFRAWIIFLTSSLILSGCLNQKNLPKGQYLLVGQKIKGNNKVDSDKLEPFFQQKPNRKILGATPYLWVYYLGKKFFRPEKVQAKIAKTEQKYNKRIEESSEKPKKTARLKRKKEEDLAKLEKKLKDGNYLMRVVGEPPVVFDSTLARKTAMQMQSYLFSKSYFGGNTDYSYKIDSSRQQATVTYLIDEGVPHVIRKVELRTDDQQIDTLLKQNQYLSLIKPGENYDADNFSAERERIEKILKDNGYFDFSRQYVTYQVDSMVVDTIRTKQDTTLRSNIVDITTEINNPANRDRHKVYVIDQINFVTDAGGGVNNQPRDTTIFNNVRYIYRTDRYSKKVLDSKLLFHPGQKYSQTNALGTQRLLNSLNIFRFANLNFDTTGNKFVANITTSNLEKYQITDELGLTVLQGVPGPFGNVTFRVRNVFGGLEMFEATVRAGIEGQSGFTTTEGVYKSTQVGVSGSVIFPQMLLPGGFRFKSAINRLDPRTRVSLGLDLTDRPEYRRVNIRGAITYTWQKDRVHSYSISPVDINYVYSPLSRQDPKFRAYLKEQETKFGNPLIRSFNTSFVTSINGFYQYNDNILGQNQVARYFRLYLEAGGTWLNLLSKEFIGELQKDRGVQYFSFYRINPDYRFYLPTGPKSTLAFRITTGLAIPYGGTTTLPYEKFYFSGGTNSVRAWQQRRLGPGTSQANTIGDTLYRFEQPGNIMLEANAEYRFKMISFINGAFFVDAGNVWTLKEQEPTDGQPLDPRLAGGSFQFNRFYKQIAVGAGFGLRLDFSFLILRLDAAVKVLDPAQPEGQRYVLNKFTFKDAFDTDARYRAILNLSIGYPF